MSSHHLAEKQVFSARTSKLLELVRLLSGPLDPQNIATFKGPCGALGALVNAKFVNITSL